MTEANKIFTEYMLDKEEMNCNVYVRLNNRQLYHGPCLVSHRQGYVRIWDTPKEPLVQFLLHAVESIRVPESNSKNLEIKFANTVILLMKTHE